MITAKTIFPVFGLSFLLVGCAFHDDHTDLKNYIKEIRARPQGNIEPLPPVRTYDAFIYGATALRSPFDQPVEVKAVVGVRNPDIKPDLNRDPEFLESFNLDELSMVGMLEQKGALWSLIRDGAGGIHRVTLGNFMGKNHGKIMREEFRQEKKKEFITQLVAFCLFAGIAAYLWITSVDNSIENQRQRNKLLEDEIVLLEAQVKEIQELKKKRSELIARMKVIQDLQGTRPTIVRYFDELVRSIPDGIFINSLVRTGDMVAIEGVTESANRVSTFMRQLDESPWFAEPNLKSVTNDPKFGEQAARFSLQLKTVLPAEKDEKKGGGNG